MNYTHLVDDEMPEIDFKETLADRLADIVFRVIDPQHYRALHMLKWAQNVQKSQPIFAIGTAINASTKVPENTPLYRLCRNLVLSIAETNPDIKIEWPITLDGNRINGESGLTDLAPIRVIRWAEKKFLGVDF